jgi:hypothetical protein
MTEAARELPTAQREDLARALLGASPGLLLGSPWKVTSDDAERIEVRDSDGQTVWLEDWTNLPDDFDAASRARIVAVVRARIHLTVTAVNCHAPLLAQLVKARRYVAGAVTITRQQLARDDLAAIDATIAEAGHRGQP